MSEIVVGRLAHPGSSFVKPVLGPDGRATYNASKQFHREEDDLRTNKNCARSCKNCARSCLCERLYACVYVCMFMFVCVYVCMFMYVNMLHMVVYAYTFMSLCLYVCMSV